MQDALNGCDET